MRNRSSSWLKTLFTFAICLLFLGWFWSSVQDLLESDPMSQQLTGTPHSTKFYGGSERSAITEPAQKYHERSRRIRQICERYGLPPREGEPRRNLNRYQQQWLDYLETKAGAEDFHPLMVARRKPSLIYCWTRKIASTSWQILFYNLAGKKISPKQAFKGVFEFGLMKAGKTAEEAMTDESVRFFFSRHPFDRLVSTYVQKIELSYPHDITFKDNVDKIFQANGIEYKKDVRLRPSFKEFVNYILRVQNVAEFDDHWRLQWLHCHVCEWDFDVPGQIETIEDSDYILKLASITDMSIPWNNKHKLQVHGQNMSHMPLNGSKTAAYLAELDLGQIEALYDVYRMDFEMFGYTAEEYFD